MNKQKIAKQIEDNIWEAIKDISDPDSYEWEVTFKVDGKEVKLSNEEVN